MMEQEENQSPNGGPESEKWSYVHEEEGDNSAVYKSPSTPSTVTQLALLRRRAVQRRLQMAKMSMGNGGLPSSKNFPRIVTHHNRSQADDSRLDRQNDAMYVASRRIRSNNFTERETSDLLKVWASPVMQWQMKHNFGRNFRVWEAISYSMHKMGHNRTAMQCLHRVQNLTSIFYRIKKSKQDLRSFNFPYYKLIGQVLDGKKNGTIAMTGAGAMELSPALAKFFTNYSSTPRRMAAHQKEKYQRRINGNPEAETNITLFIERNSSSNGSFNMNVLSPRMSLTEGNSSIRVEARASGSRSSATKLKPSQNSTPSSKANGATAMSFSTRTGGNSTTNSGGSMKLELEENITITVEEGSLSTESDYDDSYMGTGNESPSGRNGGLPRAAKRAFSSSFNPYVKSGYGRGIPAKRQRVTSTATNASSRMDDPTGKYLAEMVDIERQWLGMERERVANERAMMMYMMQILQAIVCPNQLQDDDADGEEEGNETENDGTEEEENEFAETEEEADANDIRQMIEQEENQAPNSEPKNEKW